MCLLDRGAGAGSADKHCLEADEFLDTGLSALAPEAAPAHAAERGAVVVTGCGVDRDRARSQLVGHAPRTAQVVGVNIAAEAVLCAIGNMDGFIFTGERRDG